VVVLAGGEGKRLAPLTADRAKPAVPFGGRYRIIDFVLSNLANSGVRSVYVLTQYKSQSLAEHVQRTWGARSSYDAFVTVVPAQMRMGESWYRGTADSVFQNLHLIEEYRGDAVLVFGADHIYKMNIRQMTDFHMQKGAIATIACLPIKKAEAKAAGDEPLRRAVRPGNGPAIGWIARRDAFDLAGIRLPVLPGAGSRCARSNRGTSAGRNGADHGRDPAA
jgi:glucose-1-phosphate adenylyltransferase